MQNDCYDSQAFFYEILTGNSGEIQREIYILFKFIA